MFDSKEYHKKYYLENRTKIIDHVKKNKLKYSENKETRNKRVAKYLKDPLKRMIYNKRSSIRMAFRRGGYKKHSIPYNLLMCEYPFYIKYIESKFRNGMSWDNYGEWHIDHIKPLSLAKDETSLNKLFSYENTQPLWSVENSIKGNAYPF